MSRMHILENAEERFFLVTSLERFRMQEHVFEE